MAEINISFYEPKAIILEYLKTLALNISLRLDLPGLVLIHKLVNILDYYANIVELPDPS